MYYTYLIRCSDNSLYCGITTDIKRRFTEHKEKSPKGAKYTHTHNAEKIEIVFVSENRSLASKLEYQIKRLTKENWRHFNIKKKKEILISEKSLDVLGNKADKECYTLYKEK